MKASEFDYHLPPDLIAQHPAELRDGARMMVLHRDRRQIEHRTFGDFTWYLRAGDLLVLNNTRVIPARIFGRKSESGGRVELLFLEELGPGIWDCLLHARRRPKTGDRVELAEGQARAVMLADGEMGRCRVRVEAEMPVLELLERHGEPPLPPYIQRVPGVPPSRGSSGVANGCRGEEDKERYQTVYAEKPGAVAAPTAGLHFTPDVLERARAAGAQTATVTLHVGLGTFRPVTAANIEDHVMEPERYEVP
ncbi:MAG TPA: S-adenosylmethionine:tRNA ribosyltransferase-isomerase, partial [Kiritimatiellia bacterium]